jgi:hypothetical protein
MKNYSVKIEKYAESCYVKKFQKKYRNAWSVTLKALIFELERIDNLLKTEKAKTIVHSDKLRIVKVDFSVAGTNVSAKASGNRMVVIINESEMTVDILLVYSKSDVSMKDETTWWKGKIRDNYIEYKNIIT